MSVKGFVLGFVVGAIIMASLYTLFLSHPASNSKGCENLLCENFTKKPDRIVPCELPSICEGHVILAFYGPKCYYSLLQAQVLAKVYDPYKGKVKLYTICTPAGEAEKALCENNTEFNISGKEAERLREIFNVWGTPTLIFDCKYKRVGTAAAYDKAYGTHKEEDDLKKIFEILYGTP